MSMLSAPPDEKFKDKDNTMNAEQKKDKKRLVEWFCTAIDAPPDERWTIIDVKAVVYTFISDNNGGETWSSATDTICREKIRSELENRLEVSRDRLKINGNTFDRVEMYFSDEYFDAKYKDADDDDSDNSDAGDADDDIEIQLPPLIPIATKLIMETPGMTYTNLLNDENFPKLIEVIRAEGIYIFQYSKEG
uniref:Uncharacterized protein n=1 Tax=Marseillevirus LCMAC201 TaxID=2506605 RepID=A0A481YWI3_9VIRU|nr:MAG: hypothetical protein LCMAC201_01530 [Marseillevirus LCMAC201]